MYSFLVTFHMNNGHSYNTVILGESLEAIKNEVRGKLDRGIEWSHFDKKDKKDVSFTIIFENISCIEYEILSIERIIEFNELDHLSDDFLKIILDHFDNDFVLGISLLHAEKNLIEKIISCLPDNRKKIVSDIIKLELGKIKMNDVLIAQNNVIEKVTELHHEKKIRIDFE